MWLVKSCCVLIACFCVGVVAVLATSRPAYRDPFAPFERMIAGQPVSTDDPACDLHSVQTNPPSVPDAGLSYCALYPAQGIFALASAFVHEDRFVQTSLRIDSRRDGGDLYLGDVVLRWGRPDIILKDERAFYVRWTAQGLYGLIYPRGTTARFDYWLPVASMMISLSANSAVIPS